MLSTKHVHLFLFTLRRDRKFGMHINIGAKNMVQIRTRNSNRPLYALARRYEIRG